MSLFDTFRAARWIRTVNLVLQALLFTTLFGGLNYVAESWRGESSRIDLTHEYARAVLEQNLTYMDLKLSARDSLEHSFLHGESLWAHPDFYAQRKPACAEPIAADSRPAAACQSFLDANEKAAQQWELERRFWAFEARF